MCASGKVAVTLQESADDVVMEPSCLGFQAWDCELQLTSRGRFTRPFRALVKRGFARRFDVAAWL
jgi:hypothetical protein